MVRIARLALATLAIMGVASIHAAPTIVTDWEYDLSSVFTAAAPVPGVSGVGTTVLSWGTDLGDGLSSLSIGNNPLTDDPVATYIGGGAIPPAFWAAGNSLTHTNNAIGAPSLTSATLTATLTLEAVLPVSTPGLPGVLPPLTIDIAFSETPNSAPCAIGTSPTPCNDIFVLTGGLLNQAFSYDPDGNGLQTYFINVFPTSGGVLSQLPNAGCAAAGQSNGCIGFSTPEGQATTLAFGFTISTDPFVIPEPGILVLIGVALAVLGIAARQRKS